MIKLNDLIPINLLQEKEKFFAKAANYNPQFTYHKAIKQSDLNFYGKTSWQYRYLAKKILRQAEKENLFQKKFEHNNLLNETQVKKTITEYLSDYSLEKKYQVIFKEKFTSRFAVNFLENSIKIRLPINFDQKSLICTLNHEVGTHILRQENYLKQVWYRRKKAYGFSNHLRTEEGLAVVHQYLDKDQQLIYQTALSYLGTHLASQTDFKTLYQFFYQHLQDPQKAWAQTLKNKRGLTDTSLPGGFNKSLVYLEGFVQVLKYLRTHHYNPTLLYYGKLAIKDINKAQKINPNFEAILPKFYTDNQELYQEKIKSLAKRNFIF